ncbi:MAG TPA: PIG-L family deacetylase, partial [Anaerolineae bacterium]|nr:PIG-L family deacetylase [Anaerolineae bacterium]
MSDTLKLMCILAHPDDESLGMGGILAKYAAEGVETYLVTATRGEHGWTGKPADYPGPTQLGQTREGELRRAAKGLGIREVTFLDYIDGSLDEADPTEVTNRLVAHLRRVRPQVVVTFDPNGAYGHPDHIAIAQFNTAAVAAAADPGTGSGRPHRGAKLYYRG